MFTHDLQFKHIINSLTEVVVLYNKDLEIEFVSNSITKVLGYQPDEYIQSYNFNNYIHSDDVELMKKTFQEILNEPNKPFSISIQIRHKDGSWIWIDSSLINMLNTPNISSIIVEFKDITNKKIIEEKHKQTLKNLTKFEGFAVNRELRMVELKEEVNMLLQRLNEPPKYNIVELKISSNE